MMRNSLPLAASVLLALPFAGCDDDGSSSAAPCEYSAGDGITIDTATTPDTISVDFGAASTQVAAGDHDHDAVYYTETEVDATFAALDDNDPATTPFHWDDMTGIPAEIADGDDIGVASVDGVTSAAGNIDLVAGAGIAITPDDPADTITISASLGLDDLNDVSSASAAVGDLIVYNAGAWQNMPAADTHDHDDVYVNVDGDTMTGTLTLGPTSGGIVFPDLSVQTTAASGVNAPPVAMLVASRARFVSADEVALDASQSYDPEGGAVEYAWDFWGTGSYGQFSSSATATHTYPSTGGPWLAGVRARDDQGNVDESKALLRAASPTVSTQVETQADGYDDISLAQIGGRPAVAYYEGTTDSLRFTIAQDADGSGAWDVYSVDSTGGFGVGVSLQEVDGRPAIAYYERNVLELRFAILATAGAYGDGPTFWDTYTVDDRYAETGLHCSLAVVAGRPAIAYTCTEATGPSSQLEFAISQLVDGSGAWDRYTIEADGTNWIGGHPSLAVVEGRPAISYAWIDATFTTGRLQFARSPTTDGSGIWQVVTVDAAAADPRYTSLAVIDGRPAVSYFDDDTRAMRFAICQTADGSGAWSPVDLEANANYHSSLALVDGKAAVAYRGYNTNLKFAANPSIDATGTWSVEELALGIDNVSLAVVGGRPAIAYVKTVALAPDELWFTMSQ